MSIATELQELTQNTTTLDGIRTDIRTALSGKGVGASTHNFDDFANDISSIKVNNDIAPDLTNEVNDNEIWLVCDTTLPNNLINETVTCSSSTKPDYNLYKYNPEDGSKTLVETYSNTQTLRTSVSYNDYGRWCLVKITPHTSGKTIASLNDTSYYDGTTGELVFYTRDCTVALYAKLPNATSVICHSATLSTCKLLNMQSVTKLADGLRACYSLRNLDMTGITTTATLTTLSGLFYTCYSLPSVPSVISNLNTSKVTTFANCFYGCYALKSVDISNWDFSKATTIASFAYACYSMSELDFSGLSTTSVLTTAQQFLRYLGQYVSADEKVKVWIPNTFDCTGITNSSYKPFNYTSSTHTIDVYTNVASATDADALGWGTINTTWFTMHYGATHNDFLNA